MNITSEQIPFKNILVVLKSDVTSPSLRISELLSKPYTSTEFENTVYKYVKVKTTNLNDDSISSIIIKFAVPKSWLTENNLKEDDVALFRYHNSKWNQLTTSLYDKDNNNIYYEAISPGFSYYVIGTKEPKTTTTTSATTTTTSNSTVQTTTTLSNSTTTQKNNTTTTTNNKNQENSSNSDNNNKKVNTNKSSNTMKYLIGALLIIIGIVGLIVINKKSEKQYF